MKETIIGIFLMFLLMCPAQSQALDLTMSVPDVYLLRVIPAVLALYPNVECAEWDLQTVTCIKKKYTDESWVLEMARRVLVDAIKRGEQTLIEKALAEKAAAIKLSEAQKIIVPVMDDYQLTIK